MSLTLNYVSRIDRLFTFDAMLAATDQTESQARPEWNILLREGRLIEAKGSKTPHFRYRPLVGKALRHCVHDKEVYELVKQNPGMRASQLSVKSTWHVNTIRRSLRRLRETGRVQTIAYQNWVTGKLPTSKRKRHLPQLRQVRAQTIWNIARKRDGVTCREIRSQTGYPRGKIHCYLKALLAENYIVRRAHSYFPVTKTITVVIPNPIDSY